jgi:hypothetical protein
MIIRDGRAPKVLRGVERRISSPRGLINDRMGERLYGFSPWMPSRVDSTADEVQKWIEQEVFARMNDTLGIFSDLNNGETPVFPCFVVRQSGL